MALPAKEGAIGPGTLSDPQGKERKNGDIGTNGDEDCHFHLYYSSREDCQYTLRKFCDGEPI